MKMDISSLPTAAWISILIFAIVVVIVIALLLTGVLYVLLKKNIKTKLFEIADVPKQQQRELFIAEGKDQLDNQCQVAKQLLKKLRIRLYEIAMEDYSNIDDKSKEILELITYRIADRLNYDVRNDLTRNHIAKKSTEELRQYSIAKANGYYYMIYDRLYNLNGKLPEYNLPKLLEKLSISEIEALFFEIYSSAQRIAG